MPQFEERQIAGLTVRIDRMLCVGFGDCIEAAPELFVLDEEGVAVFHGDGAVTRDHLIDACRTCPVDALSVLNGDGIQLAP